MARPIKRGLSYFPLDVHVFKDPRIKKLERRFGAYGSIIFIRLLALVYEQGYYLETTIEDIVLELQEQVGTNRISYQRVLDVILMCCELDILNGSLFQQGGYYIRWNTKTILTYSKKTQGSRYQQVLVVRFHNHG